MKSVCSTICAPSWRRRERPASGSSSFPIADGSRAITKTGIIRTQASAGCKSGRSSQRETWGGEWHPDFVPQADDIVVKEHWAQSEHRILKTKSQTQGVPKMQFMILFSGSRKGANACCRRPQGVGVPDSTWSLHGWSGSTGLASRRRWRCLHDCGSGFD